MKSAITFSARLTRSLQRETTVDKIRSTNLKQPKPQKKFFLIPAQLDWLGYLMMAQKSNHPNVD